MRCWSVRRCEKKFESFVSTFDFLTPIFSNALRSRVCKRVSRMKYCSPPLARGRCVGNLKNENQIIVLHWYYIKTITPLASPGSSGQ